MSSPFKTPGGVPVVTPGMPLIVSSYPAKTNGKSPIDQLNCDSEPDTGADGQHNSASSNNPVGTPARKLEVGSHFSCDLGFKGGHYLAVGGVPVDKVHDYLSVLRKKAAWREIVEYQIKVTEVDKVALHVRIEDLRNFNMVRDELRKVFDDTARVQQTDRHIFEAATGIETHPQEGHIIVLAIGQCINKTNLNEVSASIYQAIQQFTGPDSIIAARVESGPVGNSVDLRIELASFEQAANCKEFMGKDHTVATPFCSFHVRGDARVARSVRSNSRTSTNHTSPEHSQSVFTSSSGRSRWTIDRAGCQVTLPPTHVVHDHNSHSASYSTSAAHHQPSTHGMTLQRQTHRHHDNNQAVNGQTLDMNSIRNGNEMRTTIMLRNIPNHFTVWNVKDILDSFMFGRYDFVYVRMDFAKDANVGYGFVNLCRPEDVNTLVANLDGQLWDRSDRRRLVGLSYATIQGIDCIRQKFRNSAVMEEAPDYRPKLFVSEADIGQPDDLGYFFTPRDVGVERSFPAPDNDSKRLRSIGNAQTQGLWAPGHRRRHHNRLAHRSQWDRGTFHQIRDDYGYGNNYTWYNGGYGPYDGYMPAQYGPSQPQLQYNHTYGFGAYSAAEYQPRFFGGYQY